MNSKTICMLVTNSLRKDPRVQREALATQRGGFHVIVIGQQDQHYNEVFLKSQDYFVDIIKMSSKIQNTNNFFLRAFRCVYRFWSFVFKTVSHHPSIIHCNDLNTLFQGWIASLFCGAKVVYDSHEVNTPIGEKKYSKKQKVDIIREKLLINKASKVISVSNAAAKLIGDHYNIIPNVVTNCSYKIHIDYNKEKDPKVFKILYHGIISADRGYEEFVMAGKTVPSNIQLIIRGYGPTESLIKKLIEENELEKNVILDPPVEINELITKAAESHVGVVLTKPVNANYKYTVSNKVFEYLNAGIPVILSNVPEHKYLNDKYNFGIIIDEVSPKAISNAIFELFTNKEKYNLLKKNAIATSDIMCWENESKKLINIYNSL